jgi:peptidoglycan/LPS O-acetylase OafA/YrhL
VAGGAVARPHRRVRPDGPPTCARRWVWAILLGTLLLQSGADGENRGALRLLATPMLRPVAVLSYSLYLAHMTVIPAANMANKYLYDSERASFCTKFIIFVTFYTILSILMARRLHFAVEKSFLRLRNARF